MAAITIFNLIYFSLLNTRKMTSFERRFLYYATVSQRYEFWSLDGAAVCSIALAEAVNSNSNFY